ncbi:MAG: tRNA (adenine(22)-N(1))-methyltransferase [Bacillota bacterium]
MELLLPMVSLSRRLASIASYIEPGSTVADIGTDHAYLPVYLVETRVCPRAVAVEINKGPWQSALDQVHARGLQSEVSVRLGDGLQVVRPGEVNTVIIAGMGGGTMRRIMEVSPEVLEEVKRLVLQPMNDTGELRRWLLDNGWSLVEEDLVMEDGRFYEIVIAERGTGPCWDDPVLLEVGPLLAARGHPLLLPFLDHKLKHHRLVLEKLTRSGSQRAAEKIPALLEKVERMERIYGRVPGDHRHHGEASPG